MEKIWYGIIVIAYKTNPLRILLLRNIDTHTITPIAGSRKRLESKTEAAIRETYEEAGWIIRKNQLTKTRLKHKFIYGPQKVERAFEKGENQVFLLNADTLSQPIPTKDTKEHKWYHPKEALRIIDFYNLKSILRDSIELIKEKENI